MRTRPPCLLMTVTENLVNWQTYSVHRTCIKTVQRANYWSFTIVSQPELSWNDRSPGLPESTFLMLTNRKVASGEEIETNVAMFQLTITKHAHINVLSSGGCEFMICENTTKWTQRKKFSRYACYSSCNQLYEKCARRIIQKNKPLKSKYWTH